MQELPGLSLQNVALDLRSLWPGAVKMRAEQQTPRLVTPPLRCSLRMAHSSDQVAAPLT